MQQKIPKMLTLTLVLLNILTTKAQQSANSAGGNAAGTGGSSAFSVGQPVYTVASGTTGSLDQGVQQPFVASNQLPINFQTFSGKCNQGYLKLTWATSFESNNSHFDVEKSIDASKWQKIATLSGAINSKEIKKYEYQDNEAGDKVNYYRIKQIDLDGKYSFSNVIVALGCGQSLQSISVYPNPTTDLVNIKVNHAENSAYELYDFSGKIVESLPLTESTYLSLQNKIGSVYFLKILSNGKEIKTFKIIKN